MKSLIYFLLINLFLGYFYNHAFCQQSTNTCKRFKNIYTLTSRSAPYKTSSIASQLLSGYDVGYVFLDIKLETTNTYIEGCATLKIRITSTMLDTIAYELLQDLTVDSVKVNGIIKPFTHSNDIIKIISSGHTQHSIITTQVYYHGTSPDNGFFSGLSSKASQTWGNRATWSLSESFHARDWWPCKQVLADRIDSSDVWITTSDVNKAGSNGLLVGVINLPNNKKQYQWHNNRNINYYLISVAVSKYIEYNTYAHPDGLQDSILIQNYIYDNPQTLPYFKNSIDKTGRYIEEFSRLFGLYPYYKQKYGHCMAPLSGGEEHQTMTTIGFFNDDLVDHELGHQWWGDNVTCASWQDIFINEGFASYCEVLGLEKTSTTNALINKLTSIHNNIMSASNGSVYVPFSDINNENRIFDDRLSYDKGSAIIHMMRFEAQNDSLFFAALKKMQIDFKDSVATGEDLKNILSQVTGINYQTFFDQWYYGEGYPSFQFEWYTFNDTLYINSKQTTSTTTTPLFKMLMDFYVNTNSGVINFKPYQTSLIQTFKMPLNGKTVTSINFNKNKWLLAKQTSLTQLTTGLPLNTQIGTFIYPNPAQNQLNLFCQQNNTFYFITDVQGRIVKNGQLINGLNSIDINDFDTGIYFISINHPYQTPAIYKFMKE
jgi:aminopeptidase N